MAAVLDEEREGGRALALGASPDGSHSSAHAAGKPDKVKKGRSAFEIFRAEWIAGQHAHRKFNPCSTEAWKECKQAFDLLPADRLRELEALSESEKTHAQLARKLLKAKARAKSAQPDPQVVPPQPLAALPALPPTPAPEAPEPDPLAAMMQRDESQHKPQKPPLPASVACTSLKTTLVGQARGDAQAQSAQSSALQDFPIAPADIRQRTASRTFNTKNDVAAFAKKASHMQASPAGGSMPAKVEYPKCCGHLCRTTSTLRSVKFHDKLVSLIHRMIRDHCSKPKDVPAANLLFAAECYKNAGSDMPDHISFFAVASAAGQQAHHVPHASLAQLTPLQQPCVAGRN